ncbi:alpha/beta-hydrolase [Xylaria cf. heliscus]|nr:alpha/beta-hydrolase [Xylaria cf. heliscus]
MGFFSRKKAQPHQGNVGPPLSGHNDERNTNYANANLSPTSFQPAGALPPPPYGWRAAVGPSIPCHRQDQGHRSPIIVNQHYYLSPPPHPHHYPQNAYSTGDGGFDFSVFKSSSTSNLIHGPTNIVNQFVDDGLPRWHAHGTQLLNQSAALCDRISSKFDDVMTLIDRDKFMGDENELFMYQQPQASSSSADTIHHPVVSKGKPGKKNKAKDAPKGQTSAVAASLITSGYFAKVDLYANSRLPLDLPPFRVPIPVYPLLCLAAQYAERVYEKPQGAERDAHVNADWKTGTKAMYIKSVPMDNMGTIVFAIRGTATFWDWTVNLNTAPTAPTGFLDDARNFCHAGFLSVARKMIAPVASRLRHLLEEDPGRCSYSLLITGHSAGGAIASLLYMHMLATSKASSSELNLLTGCFKRIHCITFGSPPVSLFPLQAPHRHELRTSLFYNFINEGDPVTRADKAYVKSLLELFAAPAPSSTNLPVNSPPKPTKIQEKKSTTSKTSKLLMKSSQSLQSKSVAKRSKPTAPGPIWRVPPSTLSNAGRIIVLRSGNPQAKVKRTKTVEERLGEGVVAQVASDEKLRGIVWGDPVCHVMKLYSARIEALAVGAVTAKGY